LVEGVSNRTRAAVAVPFEIGIVGWRGSARWQVVVPDEAGMMRVASASEARVLLPTSVEDAVEMLAPANGPALPLAGGTWVMRGAIRGDGFEPAYVLVSRLPELQTIERNDAMLTIGAAVTHQQLADTLEGDLSFLGLAAAAAKSANPAIRRIATVGGNLATSEFSAGDLVPALIASGSEVELVGPDGSRTLAIADYLASRRDSHSGSLITQIKVPVRNGVSAHERLTLRKAGDYPVVIVDVYVELDGDGIVSVANVAIGSVESVARSWPTLAARLQGSALDPGAAELATRELSGELSPRDGTDVSGWYRLKVLPTVVGRAVRALQTMGAR
jgi:carbon-monoxide dehydrogenase medium subunit